MTVRRRKNRDRRGRVKERIIVDVDVQLPDGSRQRVRRVSPVQTRRGAERFERELRQSLLDGSYNSNTKEVPTLREFSKEFLETYVAANNKKSEQISKESIFRHRLNPELGRRRLDSITMRDVERIKATWLKEGLSPKRINNMLSVLGKTLRYAAELELIETVPRIKLMKVPPPDIDFLDFEELDQLIAAALMEPEALAAVLCASNAGLRAGEIKGLQWGDIDFRNSRLTVQRTIYQGHEGSPKGGRLRRVEMTSRLVAALKGVRHLRGLYVFCGADGRPWTRGELDSRLSRSYKRAKLRKVGWHTLRHTFCSHLAMRGAPARSIQELAGHASLSTTQRYMHLSPSAKREAIDLLEKPPLRHNGGTCGERDQKAE